MRRSPACFIVAITAAVWFLPAAAQDTSGKRNIPPAVPIQVFDPSHQKSVSYVDQKIRAILMKGTEANSIKIADVPTGKEQLIELPAEMAQVDDIDKGFGSKLVVRGMVNGSTSEVAVIDPEAGKLIDKFVCYLPAISYDGHYIAFIKFYPAHFAEGVDDHYMLYDLSITPAQNRPPGVRNDDWRNVGSCIYPPGVGNADNDNVGHFKDTEHYSDSRLFWNPSQEQLFFADGLNSDSQLTLVLADVAVNGNVSLRALTQGTAQFCPPTNLGVAGCSVLVRNVQFQDAGAGIAVTFESVPSRQHREIEYKSAQFR
jgi:hypothetical protein